MKKHIGYSLQMNVFTIIILQSMSVYLSGFFRLIHILIWRMGALHRNYKMQSMFQGAWRGLKPEVTTRPR